MAEYFNSKFAEKQFREPPNRYPLIFFRISFADWKRFLPVFPIFIFEENRDRRADGRAVTHAREDMDLIGFNLHPATAAVTLLPPPQLTVKNCLVHLQSSGQAGKKGDQSLAMRLP